MCALWVELPSQARNIRTLSSVVIPALLNTGGRKSYCDTIGGDDSGGGGGGDNAVLHQGTITLILTIRERFGSLDNLSLLEMFGSASPESTNSALLAFRLIMIEKNPEIQVPFSGQSFSNHPSSLWRIGARCLRSTPRNTEHRKPGIGGLKAEKISTEDSSTWLATNLL